MSEEDIIKLFEKTLSGIYRRHLHRTAVRFVSIREDVEDLTQKTILKAVEAFSKGAQLRKSKGMAFKILRNCLIDRHAMSFSSVSIKGSRRKALNI